MDKDRLVRWRGNGGGGGELIIGVGVGAGSEEHDGLLLRVQQRGSFERVVVCWFEVESAVVCWMGLVGVGVVIGISIVEAKRWKGGLGFGACYQKKKVISFFFFGGEGGKGEENERRKHRFFFYLFSFGKKSH